VLSVRPSSQSSYFSVPFTVSLNPSDDTRDVVLRMPAPTIVRGRVTNRGTPRAASVYFLTNGTNRASTKAGPDGHFEMKVPPGEGELRVQPAERGHAVSHRQSLRIAEGESHTIDIHLDYVVHVIAGRVVDTKGRPHPDVRVGIQEWGLHSNSDMNGRFELRSEAPAEDAWAVTAERFPFTTQTRMIPSNTKDALLVFPRPGVVALRVRDDATNRIVPRFSMRWRDVGHGIQPEHDSAELTGIADANGVARLELPVGQYEITIDATLFGYPVSKPITIEVAALESPAKPTEVRLRKVP